ncbi:hypothetical protein LEP1GSC067_3242 [Leptospira interrogans serovar Lora str. TE 1992]|uniref:Uncharacterized protein n=1 Tax=Leptospira interrogans serovar Lora str. TE 1992 TaxID=1193028 RepID=M3CQ40_LEPIR|nr:hypothetical protein LEP1GSC067_3242 [Leptospira interrogans serovar Lora str. TE 1992]
MNFFFWFSYSIFFTLGKKEKAVGFLGEAKICLNSSLDFFSNWFDLRKKSTENDRIKN